MRRTNTAKTDLGAEELASIYLKAMDDSKAEGRNEGAAEQNNLAMMAQGQSQAYPATQPWDQQAGAGGNAGTASQLGVLGGQPTMGDAGGDPDLLALYQQVAAEKENQRLSQQVEGEPPVTAASLPLFIKLMRQLFKFDAGGQSSGGGVAQ